MDDLVHLRSPRGRYWRDLGAGLSEDIATAHAYSRADAERLVARLNDGTTIVEIEKPAIAAEREVSKMQQHQFNIGDLVRMRSGWSARAKRLMSPAGMRIFLPILRVLTFPSAIR